MKNLVQFLFIFSIYNNIIWSIDGTQCCPPNEKITSSLRCANGSRIDVITCSHREILYSTIERPLFFELEDDGVLSITQDEDLGFLRMNPDKYCIGVSDENETDIAILCLAQPASEPGESNVTGEVFFYLRVIFALLSALCFAAIAIIYIYIAELRDIEGKCIIHFSISFAVCHFLQCIGPLIIDFDESTCDVFTFINNFAVVCGFNWLTVMSIHIWRIVVRPIFRTQMNWFLIYLCYGYGFPIILLITSLISHLTNQNQLKKSIQMQGINNECWLQDSVIIWFYFYGPLAILVLLSTIIQLWTAKILWMNRDKRDINHSTVRLRKKCLMYLHALFVMGTLTIIELILLAFDYLRSYAIHVTMSVIDCRSMLVGGALFFIFVVLRNKVLKALAKHGLCCFTFPAKWKKLIDEEEEERDMENDEATLTRQNTIF